MLAYGATKLCWVWERNNEDETCPKVSPSRARIGSEQEIHQQLDEITENQELDHQEILEDYNEYEDWWYADYEDIEQYLNKNIQLSHNLIL